MGPACGDLGRGEPVGATMLLINTRPDDRAMLVAAVEGHDIEVVVARDADSGVEAALRSTPDLILLGDPLMAIDCFRACERLRSEPRTSTIPRVVVMDSAEDESLGRVFDSGASDVLTRPLATRVVLARITAHLRTGRLSRELAEAAREVGQRAEERTRELEHTIAGLRAEVADLRTTETALRRSEELHRVTIENILDPVFITDEDGRFTFICANVRHTLQYTIDEIQSMGTISNLISGCRIDARALAARGEIRDIEGVIVDKNGFARTYLVTARRVAIQDGSILYTCHDITERRAMERELRQNEERFRTLFENHPAMYFILGSDGTVAAVNRFGAAHLGYQADELTGASIDRVLHPDDRPILLEQLAALRAQPGMVHQWQVRNIRKDGSELWVRETARATSADDGIAILVVCEDITKWRRAEEEQNALQALVRRSASEWQATFDAVDSPIVVLEAEHNVRRLNAAALRLLGGDYRDWIGSSLGDIADREPWHTAARLTAEVDEARGAVHQVVDEPTGRTWEVAVSATHTRSPGGDRAPLITVLARDVSQLVELRDTLRRTEAMAAMGALVGGVAHEVRNPVFALSAVMDALQERFASEPAFQPYFSALSSQLARMERLMAQLLQYGRSGVGNRTPTKLDQLIEDAIHLARDEAAACGISILSEVDEGSAPIPMDRERVLTAVHNLIANAVQHSGDDREVAIVCHEVGDAADSVCIAVEDSGPGFRPQDLDHVFEPFFSRRRGGTGLGLAIAQRVIVEHGGTISAGRSNRGGAKVELVLPRRPATS